MVALAALTKVFLQGFYVVFKGFQPCRRDAAGRARHLALEPFLHGNVFRRRELVYLDAQVACGGPCLRLQVSDEVSWIDN